MDPEVLIIGGGVIGLSIARALHKTGATRITLLEKGACGQEASWAAAGMLSPQVEADKSHPFFEFCCNSRDLYPLFAKKLFDETDIDVELDQTGTLYLAFDDADIDAIHKRFEWQSKAGLAIELVSATEISDMEPAVSHTVREALFFPNDWQVENRRLVTALRRYVETNGVDLRENTRVESLTVENGRVTGAQTKEITIRADITVIATGAWTSLIKVGQVEMPIRVEPVRGEIVTFRTAERLLRHVVCSSRGYVVPRVDGRVLAGSTTDTVGFDRSISAVAAYRLKQMACEMIPSFSGLQHADHWSGLRPFVSDSKPVLGPISNFENLFLATAHFRNGILLAPLTAKLIAEKIANGKESEYFREFNADRFQRRGVSTAS